MSEYYLIGVEAKPTTNWILENSFSFQKHQKKAVQVAWIHSHVRGAKCGLSSLDVHHQYNYEFLTPLAQLK